MLNAAVGFEKTKGGGAFKLHSAGQRHFNTVAGVEVKICFGEIFQAMQANTLFAFHQRLVAGQTQIGIKQTEKVIGKMVKKMFERHNIRDNFPRLAESCLLAIVVVGCCGQFSVSLSQFFYF